MMAKLLGMVGAAALTASSAAPAAASVTDLGGFVANGNGVPVVFSTTYSAATTSINDTLKFQITGGSTPFTIDAVLLTAFTKGKGGISGTFSLFECTADCSGASTPTGTLLDSLTFGFAGASANSQNVSLNEVTASMLGNYYMTLVGSKNTGGGTTITAQAVATVTSVPEASTWAMMFLGFAALGFAGYRSRRSADLAA